VLRKLLSNIIALMMHSIIASRRLERKRLNSFLTVLTDQRSPQALFRKRSELMKGLAGITWTVLEKAIISSCLWLIK